MSIRVGLRGMRRDHALYCPSRYLVCSIFSTYNLCIIGSPEVLIASLASIATVCIQQQEDLVASIASTYSLGVA